MTRPAIRSCLLCVGLLIAQLELSLSAEQVRFDRVRRQVIAERLERVSEKKAKSNRERKEALRELFEEAGCKGDWLTEQPVKGSRVPNVICTLQGTGDWVIVVGAHFDKVRIGKGLVDNWSGALLLPSLFQSLSGQSRQFTFVFIGFTNEERGLVGSEFYVKHLTEENRAKIRAMVNMDSLGLSSTKVWVSRADKNLLLALSRLAHAMKLPVDGVNVEKVGDSDSKPFARNGIPSIDFHSVTQDTLPILHSRRDNLSAIVLEDHYNTYYLLAAYLAFLDLAWNTSVTSGADAAPSDVPGSSP